VIILHVISLLVFPKKIYEAIKEVMVCKGP
jgi:hypothetical protein